MAEHGRPSQREEGRVVEGEWVDGRTVVEKGEREARCINYQY